MKTVSYKGYQAQVDYDDGRLYIRVLHVDDLLIAACDHAADVEPALASLVDDYLAQCAAAGRKPDKPFKGSFNIRMPPEQHRLAAMAAAEAGQTLNAWIGEAVHDRLAARNARVPETPRTRHAG